MDIDDLDNSVNLPESPHPPSPHAGTQCLGHLDSYYFLCHLHPVLPYPILLYQSRPNLSLASPAEPHDEGTASCSHNSKARQAAVYLEHDFHLEKRRAADPTLHHWFMGTWDLGER